MARSMSLSHIAPLANAKEPANAKLPSARTYPATAAKGEPSWRGADALQPGMTPPRPAGAVPPTWRLTAGGVPTAALGGGGGSELDSHRERGGDAAGKARDTTPPRRQDDAAPTWSMGLGGGPSLQYKRVLQYLSRYGIR